MTGLALAAHPQPPQTSETPDAASTHSTLPTPSPALNRAARSDPASNGSLSRSPPTENTFMLELEPLALLDPRPDAMPPR